MTTAHTMSTGPRCWPIDSPPPTPAILLIYLISSLRSPMLPTHPASSSYLRMLVVQSM